MPIENEIKVVLYPIEQAYDAACYLSDKVSVIRQAYLQDNGMTVRIRKQESKEKICHWFTFKKRVNDDIIEIEQIISEDDFNRLSPHAFSWVHKKRIDVHGWDVDLFIGEDKKPYFCLAELEMPEGMKDPEYIPNFISNYILYQVPREDRRFSSKKLASEKYAKKMLQKLLVGVDGLLALT